MARFEDEVGHGVGDVAACLVRPAELDVVGCAHQQAGDVEDGLLIGQRARGRLALVVGQQQHVQPAQRAAPVVHARGRLVPQHPLARLTESLRRFGDEAAVDGRNLAQVRRIRRVGLACGPCIRCIRGAADPVLHPQHDVGQPIVELLRLCIGVDRAIVRDLVQQAAPAQVQPDLQVMAEVLRAADAGVELVKLLRRMEVRVIEVRIPADLAVRAEVDHVAAGERAVRVQVNGMSLQQAAEVAPERDRPEEPAARMVALRRVALHLDINNGHARRADRLDDLARARRRQDQRPVVIIHRADDGPLLLRLGHLLGAQRGKALGIGAGCVFHRQCGHWTGHNASPFNLQPDNLQQSLLVRASAPPPAAPGALRGTPAPGSDTSGWQDGGMPAVPA